MSVIAVLPSVAVWAFSPPVDRAGPLTVRIDGPAEVTATDSPIPIRVVMENGGQQAIRGTVRLGVIDDWRCLPAERPMVVPAGGEVTSEFRVTAGRGTYSAHYPIHAWATFESDGQPHTVHPILVLQTKLPPALDATQPLPWRPLVVTADRSVALYGWPLRRTIVTVFGRSAEVLPVGWQGAASGSRASVGLQTVRLEGDSRRVVAIHPPWDQGLTGTTMVEYALALPDARPIRLTLANAVRPEGKGDGVTFRVRVAPFDAPAGEKGKVLFDRHSAAKTWQPVAVDLSRLAGRTIRLQFEADPGPHRNTGWDTSYWAEPIVTVGTPPAERVFPPTSLDDARRLGVIGTGKSRCEVYVQPGRRGLLDARIGLVTSERQLWFDGFEIEVMGDRIDWPDAPTTFTQIKTEPIPHGIRVRHIGSSPQGPFELVGQLVVDEDRLNATMRLEKVPPRRPWFAPRIERFALGPWSEKVERVYAGCGNVIEGPEAFRLGFDGHRLSTSFVGFDFPGSMAIVQAVDRTPEALEVDPNTRHYSLQAVGDATLSIIPADNVWQAVKVYRHGCGMQAADGVPRLAGRFVFDLWGGRYGESRAQLERAFRYGLTDAAVVWHNWQRWGYDYRLPEIYPPNPRWGTEAELGAMIEACRRARVLFALHDNYIDMYPDAAGFSYTKNIAFRAPNRPMRGWLNRGRGAQAYRYRADCVEPFLRANLRTIHDRLTPTAYFIDVWSSAAPHSYWTAAGEFFSRRFTCDVWGKQFEWIRQLLGDRAPQISESGHDRLIGQLDGAQANHLRVGRPVAGGASWFVWNINCTDAERIPWFDAAYHDRFVLHGAGYPNRYQAGLDPQLHGITSDDYLATEVLTGHPAMVSQPFGPDVIRSYWLTHDLMRALAGRTIESVQFVGGNLHRQRVDWSDGGQVWVNRGPGDWQVAGQTLPQFGFYARVPTDGGTVTASVSRREGLIVELARGPGTFYCNGRGGTGRSSAASDAVDLRARRNEDDKPIDFGPVVTAGGCRLTCDGDRLLVTPLPGTTKGTTIEIRWNQLPWQLSKPTHIEAIAESGQVVGRKPVGETVRCECDPSLFAYRFSRL
ncbi:MAG: hypothetical protein ACC645_03290 [Pirellulales bacterium]